VADNYDKHKVRKYEQVAMENDAAIKPFIVETTGAYGHD